MMNRIQKCVFFLAACSMSAAARAENNAAPRAERSIQIVGRNEVTVTQAAVFFGDIAEVSSNKASDDQAVISLKKISIDKSPHPGESAALSGYTVLDKLRSAGVDLRAVSYTLPREIKVRRAGRALRHEELKAAIEAALQLSGDNIEIKNILLKNPIQVMPEITRIEALPFNVPTHGRKGFSISVRAQDEPVLKFNLEAEVNEWAEVPVARRALGRGEVVRDEDLMMARLNMAAVPQDTLLKADKVVGLATSAEFSYGEVFRRKKLVSPTVVEKDSWVSVRYLRGPLEATLKGLALDAGAVGDEVRVRNESSKKIITGKVKEAGIVEVSP